MSASAKQPSARAKRFWDRMLEWYGTKFTDSYGVSASTDWAALVDRADDEAMIRAMGIVRIKYVEWPPTLPQFEAALRPPAEPTTYEKPIQVQLREFVCRNYRLTERQVFSPWVDIYQGKAWQNEGFSIVGVQVPADGTVPAIRVTVDDMRMRS